MLEIERDSMGNDDIDSQNEETQRNTSGRGFASMDQNKQREIASKGGKSQGKDNNPGNFANDREKAAAAGRIGGQHSHGGGRSSTTSEDTANDSDI